MSKTKVICLDIGNVFIFPDGKKISQMLLDKFGFDLQPSKCKDAFLKADFDRFNHTCPLLLKDISMADAWCKNAGIPLTYAKDVWDFLINAQLDPNLRYWVDLHPYSHEFLQTLKDENFQIAAISNTDGDLKDDLIHHDLFKYFDYTIDSQVVGVEKPHKKIYKMVPDKLNVQSRECLFIGDTAREVFGAIKSGYGNAYLLDRLNLYKNLNNSFITRFSLLKEIIEYIKFNKLTADMLNS